MRACMTTIVTSRAFVVNIVRQSQVYDTEHSPAFTTRRKSGDAENAGRGNAGPQVTKMQGIKMGKWNMGDQNCRGGKYETGKLQVWKMPDRPSIS